ncbi:RHS repeat-associated protein [Oxalobacteraceae bacterium GrIS 2.11]
MAKLKLLLNALLCVVFFGLFGGESAMAQAVQSPQTIVVNYNVPKMILNASPVTFTATATSGGHVYLSAAPVSVCSFSGYVLTLSSVGNCTVTAEVNATMAYLTATTTQVFVIQPNPQTITFNPPSSAVFGALFGISAISTSALPVQFTSATTDYCTVSGSVVTPRKVGPCTINADQPGNTTSWAPAATVQRNIAITKATPIITFTGLGPQTFGTAPFSVTAKTTSLESPIVFSSSTTGICTVSGSTVTMIAGGSCTINADQPAFGDYYAAATVSQPFTVNPEAQTISFPTIAGQTLGVAAPFAVPVTTTSPLPITLTSTNTSVCTIANLVVTLKAGGQCILTASQSGNASYLAATPITNSFTVSILPTISITAPIDGSTSLPNALLTYTAAVTPGTYTISDVSFYTSVGTLICGGLTAAPWSCPSSVLPAGGFSVHAVVTTTTANVSVTSLPIILTIGTLAAPVTSVTPLANPIVAPSLGNPVAGTLPGNLGVNGGAATYDILLALPPGVAGLTPNLALNYSSQKANGFLGMGWTLGGLSSIQRCNKTIAQDGVTSGVNFTISDRLCLDGQRLILLTAGTSATGNPDADYWTVGATYSMELTDFSRITSYAGAKGLAFKVETKSGRIRYFGDQGDGTSYIKAQGLSTGQAMAWALGQEQDLSGNYYTVSYVDTSTTTTTGELLPSQIQYGGNNQTGLAASLSVVFNYNCDSNHSNCNVKVPTRTDNSIRYVGGAHNDMASLLGSINVYTGLVSIGAATKVREYDLTYTTSVSSGRSMILSVQMQALNPQTKSMVAFPATSFNWGAGAPPQFTKANSNQNFLGPVAPLINGVVAYKNIIWADFNGDGMLDAMVIGDKSYIYIAKKGGGFAAPVLWTVPAAIASTITRRQNASSTIQWPITTEDGWGFVGDFDGDGSSDLFVFGGYVCLSQMKLATAPSPFSCVDTGTNNLATSGLGSSLTSFAASDYLVMDTTGSGRQDILMRNISTEGTRCVATTTTGDLGYQCGTYAGTNFAITGTFNQNPGHKNVFRGFAVNTIGNFSGSGRQDLFRLEVPPSGVGTLFIEVCTTGLTGFNCSKWGDVPSTQNNGTAGSTYLDYPPYIQGASLVADVNADGLTDILFSGTQPASGYGTDAAICYSTGANFDCHNLTTAQGTDSVIQHIGPIDSDGSIKTLSFVYDKTGESGAWRTCSIQNNSVLNCQSIAGGAAMAYIPYLQPNALPDPIIQLGGYLNDGTLNMLAYSLSVDYPDYPYSTQPVVYNPTAKGTNWIAYTLAPNPNLAVDKLVSVTNGVGRASTVTYTQGGQPSVYTQYSGAGFPTYPQQSVPNPGYLVSALFDSNGQGGVIETDYTYQGQLTDAYGRGSLGFSNTSMHSQLTGFTTLANYSQSWPFTGLVTSTSTIATLDNNTIISSTNNVSNGNLYNLIAISNPYYAANAPNVGGRETSLCVVCFAYLQTGTTHTIDLQGQDLGTVQTTAYYDNFGNQLSSKVLRSLNSDPANTYFQTQTSNTWDNGTGPGASSGSCIDSRNANYVIGKLCTTVVQNNNETASYLGVQSGAAITRSFSNLYFNTGLLEKETLAPGQTTLPLNNQQVANIYARDGCGNVNAKTQQWLDPVSSKTLSRSTSMTFTSDCRFPASSTNAMGQTERYTFDSATGAKTSYTDVNNLTTTWYVDGLGRIFAEGLPDNNVTIWNYNNCQSDCPGYATMVTVKTHNFYDPTSKVSTPNGVPELIYANPLGQVIRTMSYGFDGTPIMIDRQFDSLARQVADYQPFYASVASNGAGAVYPSGILAMQRTGIDSLNRTTQLKTLDTHGAGLYTNTTYAGAVRTIVNPSSETRVETRDVLGQIVSEVDNATAIMNAPATTTSFAHDPFGNLTQTTDPAGNLIKITYDVMGHKIQLNDPDLGIINYSVDPLGRTWKQISPNEAAAAPGQATMFNYDFLDRMISRIEPDLNSYFSYDIAGATGAPLTAAQITSCQGTYSCGKLAESYTSPAASGLNVGAINSASNAQETYTSYRYDSLGRPSNRNERLDPATYNYLYSETVYDAWGREVSQISVRGITGHFDPAKVYDLRYNNMGYLQSIEREAVTLWQVETQDAANRVTTAHLASGGTSGDGLIATRCYNAYTGRLDEAVTAPLSAGVNCSTTPARATVMESYFYDGIGNVSQRNETWNQNINGTVPQSFIEGITYDGLNRLATSSVSGQTQSFTYTKDGNITSKTGVGTSYIYGNGASGGPHAVQSITGIPGTFKYDANGNQLTGNGRKNSWTSFDMPLVVSYTNPNTNITSSSQFTYGPSHERRTQSLSNGTMIYYGGVQEVAMNGTTLVSVKTYWPLGIGMEIDRPSQNGSELNWTHTDHLGSVIAITDVLGNLKESLEYDAWGSRRSMASMPVSVLTPQITENTDDKGFTSQEHIDSLELVHFNGRLYDPLIGKFISADPHVTDPLNGQNFNRYSYVVNNPMNRIDPTGFEDVTSVTIHGSCPADSCNGAGVTFGTPPVGNTAATSGIASGRQAYARSVVFAQNASRGAIIGGIIGIGISGFCDGVSVGLCAGFNPLIVTGSMAIGGAIFGNMMNENSNSDSGSGSLAASGDGANSATASPPQDGGDGDDKQKKGKPERNVDQNKQVNDAARDEKLTPKQRQELGRAVEYESRGQGSNLGYKDIREIAQQIKNGTY